jgi:Fe-S oxidoreductase
MGFDLNPELGIMKGRATYQDPCHLEHTQRIRVAPRKLLAAVPGLELIELKEAEICCGGASVRRRNGRGRVMPVVELPGEAYSRANSR